MKSLPQLVTFYNDKYPEDGPEAVRRIRMALRKQPRIWSGALKNDSLMARMLDPLIRDIRHGARTAIHRTHSGDTLVDYEKRMAGRQRNDDRMQKSVLWWPISSGKALIDCTKGDLLESVATRRAQAVSEHLNAAFEEAVAQQLPNDRVTVGKALDKSDIVTTYSDVFASKKVA